MPTYRNDGSDSRSVERIDGTSVFVPSGNSVETYKILGSPFTKTSDAPYFPLVKVYEAAFVTPGTKTDLLACKFIRLTADGDGLAVKANVSANTSSLALIDGIAMDIENNGEIESMVFEGAGTVKIEGF